MVVRAYSQAEGSALNWWTVILMAVWMAQYAVMADQIGLRGQLVVTDPQLFADELAGRHGRSCSPSSVASVEEGLHRHLSQISMRIYVVGEYATHKCRCV